jgi:DNA-binding SARP family transcriptional activator
LKEAAKNLDELYRKFPYFTKLKQHLIEVYCESGDNSNAIKLLNDYI